MVCSISCGSTLSLFPSKSVYDWALAKWITLFLVVLLCWLRYSVLWWRVIRRQAGCHVCVCGQRLYCGLYWEVEPTNGIHQVKLWVSHHIIMYVLTFLATHSCVQLRLFISRRFERMHDMYGLRCTYICASVCFVNPSIIFTCLCIQKWLSQSDWKFVVILPKPGDMRLWK